MKNKNYVISIIVCTYNQENTIEKCLSSLVNQILNVEYEIIIGDDESKDQTSKICQEFKANHRNIKYIKRDKNIGMIKNYMDLISESKGEFIAQCAGDDYWIDDYKLQKQYDFLRQNSNYGMVHTNYKILENNKLENSPKKETKSGYIFDLLLEKNIIIAVSILIRKNILINAINEKILSNKTIIEDYTLWLYTAQNFPIGYIDDITCVYLKNTNSLSNFTEIKDKNNFINEIINIQIFFAKKNKKVYLIKERIKNHYNYMIYESLNKRTSFNIHKGLANLIKIRSLNFYYIKYYVYHIFPINYCYQFFKLKHK